MGLMDVAFRDALLLDYRTDNSADAVPDDGRLLPGAFRQLGQCVVYHRRSDGDDRFLGRRDACDKRCS